jgi:hypothetical protein
MQQHCARCPQVAQFWNIQPGDGSVYFTLRPAWMRSGPADAFYVLHPEERTYRTSRAAAEQSTTAAQAAADAGAGAAAAAAPAGPRGSPPMTPYGALAKLPSIVNGM